MAGVIARLPWPSESLDDGIVVTASGNGFTLKYADPLIRTRDYGADESPENFRASQPGDTLSWSFDHWEGRPSSSPGGAWESFGIDGLFVVCCPSGQLVSLRRFFALLDVPNV